MPYPSYRHPSPHYRTPGRSVVLFGAAAASGIPAGNAQLVTDLGGDSVVLAFYDVRNNLTTSSGVVDAWDDTRGPSGYGPQLTASATERPAWDGSVITGDGVNDILASDIGGHAIFATDVAKTVIVVGVVVSGTSGYFCATIFRGGNPQLGAGSSGGTLIYNQVPELVSSTVSASTTRRLIFASKNGTTTAYAEVPGVAQQTNAIAAHGAGNGRLQLFAGNGTNFSANSVRAVLVLNGHYSTAQRDSVITWSSTHHSHVAA